MASSKEILSRIGSVSVMQQMTNTMKLISSSKAPKAQQTLYAVRNFVDDIEDIRSNVFHKDQDCGDFYIDDKTLLIIVGSDKGFCGGFNNNVFKEVVSIVGDKKPKILVIGSKIIGLVKKIKVDNIEIADLLKKIDLEAMKMKGEEIYKSIKCGKISNVVAVYNKFDSSSKQYVIAENLFMGKNNDCNNKDSESDCNSTYIFESNRKDIENYLGKMTFIANFVRVTLDSYASEHATRVVMMSKASDNANELLKSLKTLYNKTRQEGITTEIITMSAGVKCLKKGKAS